MRHVEGGSLPEVLIFLNHKILDLALLNLWLCSIEKSKLLVKSASENRKPIRDGYSNLPAIKRQASLNKNGYGDSLLFFLDF